LSQCRAEAARRCLALQQRVGLVQEALDFVQPWLRGLRIDPQHACRQRGRLRPARDHGRRRRSTACAPGQDQQQQRGRGRPAPRGVLRRYRRSPFGPWRAPPPTRRCVAGPPVRPACGRCFLSHGPAARSLGRHERWRLAAPFNSASCWRSSAKPAASSCRAAIFAGLAKRILPRLCCRSTSAIWNPACLEGAFVRKPRNLSN